MICVLPRHDDLSPPEACEVALEVDYVGVDDGVHLDPEPLPHLGRPLQVRPLGDPADEAIGEVHHVAALHGGGGRSPFHRHVLPEYCLHAWLLPPPTLLCHPTYESPASVYDSVVLDEARVWVNVVPGDVDDLEAELGQGLAVIRMLDPGPERVDSVVERVG